MTIILALLMFGFIIFIHELGHFYFAKRAGVTIHEFSIGMGPKIFSKEKNGTLYSLRIFPVGGYVAMEGEDSESNDPNSFEKKTIWQRFLSIFAGPMANILLCVILLIPFFMIIGTPTTTIQNVKENSPAMVAGIKPGDKILSIDGAKVNSFEDIPKLIDNSKGKLVSVEFTRNDKISTVNVKPELYMDKYVMGVTPKNQPNPGIAVIQSVKSTYNISATMLSFLWKLVTGQLGAKVTDSLAGPVGVISMFSTSAKSGFLNVIYFTALISLNIGIVNLLPLPALDGWRILMLFIEFIRGGKKLPSKVEGMINGGGLILLLTLMVFLTYKDILRLIIK